MKLHALGFAALALVAAAAATPALGDTYTVNSTLDTDDAAPGNNTCADSSGRCTLRAAVREANAHAGADVISLPGGTFHLSLMGSGEDAAATGDLDVTEALTVNGAGIDATAIDGLDLDRVFDVKNGVAFTVRDLTIRNGAESSGGGIAQLTNGTTVVERVRFDTNLSGVGGGILQANGPLTLTDCAFDGNLASTAGGLLMAGTGALTITGTTFTGNRTISGDGAAAYSVTTGAVSISGSTFSRNDSVMNAGSLYVTTPASFTLADTTFEENSATAQVGGPLYSGPANATLTNVTSSGNFAQGLAAGLIQSGGSIQLSGSEFSDNFSVTGGNIVLTGTTGVTLSDTAARRNNVFMGPGGGIFVQSGAALNATNIEVSDNLAQQVGGAYFTAATTATLDRIRALRNGAQQVGGFICSASGNLTVSNSTVDGNTALQVAGVQLVSSAVASLSSSTISNNRADGPGGQVGGAYVAGASPSTITNTTFSGNVAGALVGGLYTGNTVTIRNATFAGNSAPMGSAVYNTGGTATVVSTIITGGANHCLGTVASGGNNIDSDGSCAFAGTGDQNGVDPQLGALADNGGPTLTHLPAPSSPAIDTGAASGCPGTDQRGQTRPADGNGDGSALCDIGAVEFLDLCPSDPNKTMPGICGCGVADADTDQPNGTADCLVNGELKARLARAKAIITALAGDSDPAEGELATIGASLTAYVKAHGDLQVANPKPKLIKLAKKAAKAVKKVTKAKAGPKLDKAKTKATSALDAMDADVLPQT